MFFDQLPNEFENYRFATVATFSCFEGFGIEGAATAVCEEDDGGILGVFLPERPLCEREFRFSICFSSHSYVDFKLLVCLHDTTDRHQILVTIEWPWDAANCSFQQIMFSVFILSTIAITCTALEDVYNGQISYSTAPDELGAFPFGAVATYSCAEGHTLEGEATRVCSGDGSSSEGYFSGTEPTCQGLLTNESLIFCNSI